MILNSLKKWLLGSSQTDNSYSYTTASGRKRISTAPLNFKIIDFQKNPGALNQISLQQIKNLEIDGIVVKGFLTTSEAQTILQNLLQNPDNADIQSSKTYPYNYTHLHPNEPDYPNQLKEYFTGCLRFRESFAKEYKVDLVGKLNALFTKLNQGHPAKVPGGPYGGSFIPFTFRMIVPGKNHIDIHCGNQFLHQFSHFYEHLTDQADVWNQLSFFTVIQQPESGGQLSVYNIAWDVAKEADIPNQRIVTETGHKLDPADPAQLYRQKFNLEQFCCLSPALPGAKRCHY